MSSCPPMTFSEVTPEKYQELMLRAQEQGLELSGESGSTSFQGMDFEWNYDAAARSLTIQCTNKPFLIPCSVIESKIRGAIG
jgi:hypothetical protein